MTLLDNLPGWVNDLGVTVGSTYYYYYRRGAFFRQKKREYRELWSRCYQEQRKYQLEKFNEIFLRAKTQSPYYTRKYQNIDEPVLEKIPILEKEELQEHIDDIVIGNKEKMGKTYTGGTTGKGIVVYSTRSSLQRRIPFIELYWELHSYHFRNKFAWFSGRNLVSDNDTKRNIFWRTNYYLNIRYYSTFHMCFKNLPYYVENLNRYKPVLLSGFPSAIHEIARFMAAKGIKPEFQLKAIFTTSETLHPEHRSVMESVFKCKVRNQYSSCEGAPFIIECPAGNLHMEMASGIIEVINEKGQASQEGEILVTSFPSRETPIIRYRIGDRMKLSGQIGCSCGWDTPIVAEIMGRTTDYLEIPGRGRIWCSQFGDCVKGVTSVMKFQVELMDDARVRVYVVADKEQFERKDREAFLLHVRERVGELPVEIVYVDDIARAKSGKHSVIKK
jgi:phenylacetate-CoA ligase